MFIGAALAAVAGTLVGMQNIFNSKVDRQVGPWTTTTLVLGLGFLASLMMGLIFERGGMFKGGEMEPWFWFSGLIGVGVVTCLTQGIRLLGPTYAVSILLSSQIVVALILDSFGWMGLVQVAFTPKQAIGVLVIVAGIAVFKLGGRQQTDSGKQSASEAAEATPVRAVGE